MLMLLLMLVLMLGLILMFTLILVLVIVLVFSANQPYKNSVLLMKGKVTGFLEGEDYDVGSVYVISGWLSHRHEFILVIFL